MEATYLVLLILAVVYIPIWIWVWRCPEKAERWHLVKYGPCVMIKTHLGIKTMDRIAKYTRFWRVCGFISKLVSAVLFLLMVYVLIVGVLSLPGRIGSGIGIQYALAIPGLNPILPLSYGIVALFFAMIVHEMGHGIQSRTNGLDVESTGLLYGVVPLGAFCEPNEEQLNKAERRVQMDVFAAGITVNTFWAIITFALMVLIVSFVTVADFSQGEGSGDLPGIYYVDDSSPALDCGIPTSAIITGIMFEDETEYHSVYAQVGSVVSLVSDIEISPMHTYYLRYELKDGTHTTSVPIQMGAFIKRVVSSSPASQADIDIGSFLYSIKLERNGTSTEYMISNGCDFKDAMSVSLPGDVATVTTVSYCVNGSPEMYVHTPVTLTSSGSTGYLGLAVTDSGFTFTTPQIMLDKCVNPFYGCSDPIECVKGFMSYLSGPFNGLDPISNATLWWYDAPIGESTWIAVKMLYWIFWLDILLAISNALPARPFDGGFLFEGGVNWLLQVFGIKDTEKRDKLSQSVSSAVSTVTLAMFFLVLLAFVI